MARHSKDRIIVDLSSDSDDDLEIRSSIRSPSSLSTSRGRETLTTGRKRPWPSVENGNEFLTSHEREEETVIVKRRVLRSGTCSSFERREDGSRKDNSCSSGRQTSQNEGKGEREWMKERRRDGLRERERRSLIGEGHQGGSRKGMTGDGGGKSIGGGKSCEEDSDDDFMMFDKDPNANEGKERETNDDDEEEEMVIVGEKVTCHCFVCDRLAPCLSWGTGSNSGDHCNASDGEESWKLMRKLYKSQAPQPFSGPNPSLNLWPPQPNTNLSLGHPQRSTTNGRGIPPTTVVGNQRNRPGAITRSTSAPRRGHATINQSHSSTGDRQGYQVNMCLSLSLDVTSSHRGLKQLQSGKEGGGENMSSVNDRAVVLSPGSKQPDTQYGNMVRGVLLDKSRSKKGNQSARLREKRPLYRENGLVMSMAFRGDVCDEESEWSAVNKQKRLTEFTTQGNANSSIAKRAQTLLNKIYAPSASSTSSSINGASILEVGGQENESILESANREAVTEAHKGDKEASLFERHTNEILKWCDDLYRSEDYLRSDERHIPSQDEQEIPMDLNSDSYTYSSGSVGYRQESPKEHQPVFGEGPEKTTMYLFSRPISPSQPPLPPTTPPPSPPSPPPPPPPPPSAPPTPLEEDGLNAKCLNHSGLVTDTSAYFMNIKPVEQTVEILPLQTEVVKSTIPENSTEPTLQLTQGTSVNAEWNETAYQPYEEVFQPSNQNDLTSTYNHTAYGAGQYSYHQDQFLQFQQVIGMVNDTGNGMSVPFYGYQHGTQHFSPWTQQEPIQQVTTEAYSSNFVSVTTEVCQTATESVNNNTYNPLEPSFWPQRGNTEEQGAVRLPWDSNNGAVLQGEGEIRNNIGGVFSTCNNERVNVPHNVPWGAGPGFQFGYNNAYNNGQMAPPQNYLIMGQSGSGPYDTAGPHMGNGNVNCHGENVATSSNDCWSFGGEGPVYSLPYNAPNTIGSHVPVNGGWGTWGTG